MPDTVKIPLDKAVVPLTLKPGEEIVVKGVLYSTEDGSRVDARATSWPGSAPGGASVDIGGYIDFKGGGLRVESYDPATHEVHARAMQEPGEVCSAAGQGSFCLPARTLVQAQSRGLTVAQWKGSLQGELVMEVPTPPPLAPVTSTLSSPLFLGGAFTVAVVGALVVARKMRKRWSETPTAQLEALAKRVRERAKSADIALGAPLLPALDRALDALKQRKIEASSPEGKRMEAMLLRVDDKLSRTERTLRAEDEKAVADDLLHDVEDALDAGDEALDVVRGRRLSPFGPGSVISDRRGPRPSRGCARRWPPAPRARARAGRARDRAWPVRSTRGCSGSRATCSW